MATEPKITKTPNGWRVDTHDGNFSYQPSESFAHSYARRWQVSFNLHAHIWKTDATGLVDECTICGELRA